MKYESGKMRRSRIEVGNKIGEWTIISVKCDFDKCICRCSCGKEKVVYRCELYKSEHPACRPCSIGLKTLRQRQKRVQKLNSLLLGKKFGLRTVVSYVGFIRKKYIYLTRCICGDELEVDSCLLLRGKQKSCHKCYRLYRKSCQVCGCIGRHKNIDLHECDCDYLGFCSTCDDFDVGSIKLPESITWQRTLRIKLLAKEKAK